MIGGMPDNLAKMRYDPVVKAVVRSLRQRCGFGAFGVPAVLVACSGGGDSQALLGILHQLSDRRGMAGRVVVGHVNHHLSEQADEAEAFLREQAEAMGVEIVCRSIHPDRHGGNLEATARKQRHAALEAMAREIGVGVIALAHHADDQVETVLMRMMRGCSPAGLSGMSWRREVEGGGVSLIRPLLGVRHEALLGFLERQGMRWFEDPLNSKPELMRNRMRKEVVGPLLAMWPKGHERTVELADQLGSWSEHIEACARAERGLFRETPEGLVADREALAGVSRPVLGCLLRGLLVEAGVPADQLPARVMAQVLEGVGCGVSRGERTWRLKEGVCVSVNHRCLTVHLSR